MLKKILPIILVLAGAGLLAAYYPPQRTLVYSDSYETLIIAKRLAAGQFLDLPLGPGGMSWQPLFYNRVNYAAVISLTTLVTHTPPIQTAQIINLAAYFATVLGIYFLALCHSGQAKRDPESSKRLERLDPRSGSGMTLLALFGALLVAVSPSILFWKSYLVSDPLAIAFLVWGFYLASIFYLRRSILHLLLSIVLIALAIAIRLEYVVALPAIYLLTKTKKTLLVLPLVALPYVLSLFLVSDLSSFLAFGNVLVHNWLRYLGIPLIVILVTAIVFLFRAGFKKYLILNTKYLILLFSFLFLVSRDWSNPMAQLQYFESFLTLEFFVITAALGYLIIKFRWNKESTINQTLLLLLAGFSVVYFDFYFQHSAVLVPILVLTALIALTALTQNLKPQKQALVLGLLAFGYCLYSLTLIHFINFPKLDYQQVEAAQLAKVITDPTAVVYTGFPQSLYYLNNTSVRYLENLPREASALTYVVIDRKTQIKPAANWEKITEFTMPRETLVDEEGLPVVAVYKNIVVEAFMTP